MNYLSYIKQTEQKMGRSLQYLVSGETLAQQVLLERVIHKAYSQEHSLLVIDDTKEDSMRVVEKLKREGYIINGAFGVSVFNPFRIQSLKNISRLRELLDTFQMGEVEKGRILAYLCFIQHIRKLEGEKTDITMAALAQYSSYEFIGEKLSELKKRGNINEEEMFFMLGKYSEVSSAGADLETIFPLIQPFINESYTRQDIQKMKKSAVVLRTGSLGRDQTLKQMLVRFVKFGIDDGCKFGTIVYLDGGYGSREELHYLCTEFCSGIDLHIFSRDIFTTPSSILPEILNRPEVKLYGRHNMSSAELLENELGGVYVQKSAYTENYDRRFGSNTPWDVLWGRNKTQGYQTLAPVKEPLYSREVISTLRPEQIILDISGRKIMTRL